MKKILFFILLLGSFLSCFAQSAKYGSSVGHRNNDPSVTPVYTRNPSLVEYNYNSMDLFVNNSAYGWNIIAGINEKQIRGYITLYVGESQIYDFSFIDLSFRIQAAALRKLNGYYIANFKSNTPNIIETGTVNMASTGISNYTVSHGDYIIFKYFRDALVSASFVDDKTELYLKAQRDTLINHRTDIDMLKSTSPANAWLIGGNTNTQSQKLGTNNAQDVLLTTDGATRTVLEKTTGTLRQKEFLQVDKGIYDSFGNLGTTGQDLTSIIEGAKVSWTWSYIYGVINHTFLGDTVLVGTGKNGFATPIGMRLVSVSIATGPGTAISTAVPMRLLKYNQSGSLVTLTSFTYPASVKQSTFLIPTGTQQEAENSAIFLEVISYPDAQRLTGLTCTLRFVKI